MVKLFLAGEVMLFKAKKPPKNWGGCCDDEQADGQIQGRGDRD